jgi:hypothetical protein
MILTDLPDYLFRFRQTSGAEVAHRARRLLLAKKLKKAALKRKPVIPVPPWDVGRAQWLALPRFEVASQAGADRNGHAFRSFEAGSRSIFFSEVHRRCGEVDIRAVWEPARLQRVVPYLLPGNGRQVAPGLKHAAQSEVLQWVADNPFLLGPHYMSPMECGLRVPVFCYCLKSMVDCSPQDGAALAAAIYKHGWWIYRNLSLYNSLGNHTICEAVGLLFAGGLFRDTTEGSRWLTRGIDLLDCELNRQILADGGPAEQSLDYHRFVLDLYWLCRDLLERNHLHDIRPWMPTLEKAEAFLAAFRDANGHPAIGDSDDGFAVAPGIHPHRAPANAPTNRVSTFPDSGYTVIRNGAFRMTFDHGPLGMAPLYNHGHADALSITLSLGGMDFLVDPGTYRYNGVPEQRRYFKSTRAHNTVNIDGLDQAVQETGFIWSAPFKTRLLVSRALPDGHVLVAEHDGYKRCREPVWHKRSLVWFDENRFLVMDRFRGRGRHEYQLNYHLHPEVLARPAPEGWQLERGGKKVFLELLTPGLELRLVRGRTSPLQGWFSPAYGLLQETNVLSACTTGKPLEVSLATAIRLGSPITREDFLARIPCLTAKD